MRARRLPRLSTSETIPPAATRRGLPMAGKHTGLSLERKCFGRRMFRQLWPAPFLFPFLFPMGAAIPQVCTRTAGERRESQGSAPDEAGVSRFAFAPPAHRRRVPDVLPVCMSERRPAPPPLPRAAMTARERSLRSQLTRLTAGQGLIDGSLLERRRRRGK